MQFEARINPKARTIYVPKIVADILESEIRIVPDTKAALLYRSDASKEEILHSLHIIEETIAGPKRISK